MFLAFANGPFTACDFEKITVSSDTSASSLDATKLTAYRNANNVVESRRVDMVVITVETNAIRYRVDGGNPSGATDTGHLAAANTDMLIEGFDSLRNFKVVCDAESVSAVLQVTYYRRN